MFSNHGGVRPNPLKIASIFTVLNFFRYICGGALLFSRWEDWEFLDGSYFCFISLSTIGFGDIVPGDKIYTGKVFDLSFIFCAMYLMLGMALIAMCFNLMQVSGFMSRSCNVFLLFVINPVGRSNP